MTPSCCSLSAPAKKPKVLPTTSTMPPSLPEAASRWTTCCSLEVARVAGDSADTRGPPSRSDRPRAEATHTTLTGIARRQQRTTGKPDTTRNAHAALHTMRRMHGAVLCSCGSAYCKPPFRYHHAGTRARCAAAASRVAATAPNSAQQAKTGYHRGPRAALHTTRRIRGAVVCNCGSAPHTPV